MNLTGINYFSQLLGTTGSMQVFYPFISGQGNRLNSFPFAKTAYSGTISNTTNFYNKSGSGFFDGNTTVRINNASGLNSVNWTAIVSFELSGQQNGVLWSNYTSGGLNSGWALGINDACKPYLEFYSASGPIIKCSNNNWGTKNTIFVTKLPGSISFDYLNYNSKLLESETFIVDDTYFLTSDNWNLGGATGTPSYFSGQRFKGYMDLFAFFSPSILPSQKLGISSGLYCDITSPSQNITSGVTTVVTGYQTGIYPIFSGTTGQSLDFFNYLTGQCGNITAKYVVNNLTGFIYDYTKQPLTSQIVHYFTGVTGGGPIENSGYSKSFGMDSVSFLKDVDSLDLSELYSTQTVNLVTLNNSLIFDRTISKFVSTGQYNSNQINFYLNTLSQFISGYSVTGSFYNVGVQISGMGFLSGNYLSGVNYDDQDTNILDIINGNRTFYSGNYFISAGQTGVSGLAISNNLVFLNGVKLASGLTYRTVGSNLILNDPYYYGITGSFWTAPRQTGDSFNSGIWNHYQTSGFGRRTSQLFLNGTREFIEQDYLEVSKFSPLNNHSIYLSNINSIYDNNGLFFE